MGKNLTPYPTGVKIQIVRLRFEEGYTAPVTKVRMKMAWLSIKEKIQYPRTVSQNSILSMLHRS